MKGDFLSFFQAENALETVNFTKVLPDVKRIGLTNQYDLFLNALDNVPFVYMSHRFNEWLNMTGKEKYFLIMAAWYMEKNGKFSAKSSYYAKHDK